MVSLPKKESHSKAGRYKAVLIKNPAYERAVIQSPCQPLSLDAASVRLFDKMSFHALQTEQVRVRPFVLKDGPYRVVGDVNIKNTEGTVLRASGNHCLCRCGGSRNMPFCDATYGLKEFVGTEAAD